MIARTATVLTRPQIERMSAMRLITGMNRFPKQTMAQHVQLTTWNTMNTCHGCQLLSGCCSVYMATTSFPRMELIDDADSNQAQALRYPVKNPAVLPCF